MPWRPEDHPKIPTRLTLVEESVERQEKALEAVVTWTRRTAIGIAAGVMGGLGTLVVLLLDKVL